MHICSGSENFCFFSEILSKAYKPIGMTSHIELNQKQIDLVYTQHTLGVVIFECYTCK